MKAAPYRSQRLRALSRRAVGLLLAALGAAAQGTGTLPLPTIRQVSGTAVALAWTTAARLNTQIWYGASGLSQHAANYLLVTSHTVTLTNLQPGVTYQARTESSDYSNPDLWSPAFTFATGGEASLQLSPTPATVAVGHTQQFSAWYSDGSALGALNWSVSGGGTVSSGGLFTAATAGSFTLTASDAHGRTATAAVIIPDPADTLPLPAIRQVSATAISLSWSTDTRLNTQVWYGRGGVPLHAYDYLLTTTHSITLTGLQPGVTYQAKTESSYYRTPDLWSPPFTFSTSAPATLQLAPDSATLATGGTQQFTASYSDGSPAATIAWHVTGGGTLSASGLFTATTPGAFTLTAGDPQGRTATATLGIIAASTIAVSVSPALSDIGPSAPVPLLASVTGDSAHGGVTWSMPPGAPGTLATADSTHATYTAPSAIAGAVVVSVMATSVSDASKSATAKINLHPISVSIGAPTTNPVGPLQTSTISATTNDPKGVTWSVSAGTITDLAPGCPNGQCLALYAASPVITANSTATITATSVSVRGKSASTTISLVAAADVTAIVPDSGPLAGGTVISIEGQGLPTTGAVVTVGGVAATNVSASSDGTLLQATVPAGAAAGAAAVAVNGAASAAQFTYSADVPGCGGNCGDVGDPYEGKGAPTSYIPLSSCQQITATGYYLVTQNLSGSINDSDSNCLELFFPSPEPSAANPVTIDLGGFTVNGTISLRANSGPVTLMNGTVDCDVAGGECINFGVESGRMHHLTVENASPTALANIDVTGVTASTNVAPTLLIDHLTSTVAATQAGQPRSRNIMDDGANGSNPALASLPLEAFDNFITCSDNASACQGIEMYDAPHSYVYHNKIVLPSSCIGCTDTARGILFDLDSSYGVAAFNELDLNGTNRGVRVREAQHISIHDNAFNLIWASDPDPVESGEARAGAVHIGENNYTLDDDSVDVYNNTFEFEGPGGVAVNSCEAADVYAFDNTATCQTTGCSNNIFGQTDVVDTAAQNPQAQTGTTINVFNDDLSALTTPNIHICGENPSGAFDCHGSTTAVTTGTACNLGASVVFTGYGTVNQVTAPCRPAPPVPPVPQVSAFVVTRPGAAAPARTVQPAATPAAGAGGQPRR